MTYAVSRSKLTAPLFTIARRQKGAISLMAVTVVLLMLAFTTLGLDTARLWVEKRDLQKAADMAALASVRFTGCGGSRDLVTKAATKAASLNGLTDLGKPNATVSLTAKRGYLSTNAKNEYVFNDVETDLDGTNATQITVTREVPASIILGGLWNEKTTLTATATARGGPPITTYAMGASVLTIDNDFTRTINDFFGGIFRKNANLDASMVQKLAASSISIEDLMKAGKFDTVEDLMKSEKTIADLLDLYEDSYVNGGGKDQDVLDALSQLVNAAKPAKAIDVLNVKVSDILSLNAGNKEALLDTEINLLNLVKTSVTVAGRNAKYALEFKTQVPGFTYKAQFNDVPQIAIGPGGRSKETKNWCVTSKATQAALTFTLGKGLFGDILSLATLGLLQVDLQLKLSFGNAKANLSYLEPKAGAAGVHFMVDTNPMMLSITNASETEDGFIGFKDLAGNKYGIAFGTIGMNRTVLSAETAVNVPVPTPVKPTFRGGSSEMKGALAGILQSIPAPRLVAGKLTGLFAWLNGTLEGVFNIVTELLMDTLGELLAKTIDPLLRIVGINFGAADITVYDVKNIMPQLVNVATE